MYQHTIQSVRDFLDHNRRCVERLAAREYEHLPAHASAVVSQTALDILSVADQVDAELSKDMTDERWYFITEVLLTLHNVAYRRHSSAIKRAAAAEKALRELVTLDHAKEL